MTDDDAGDDIVEGKEDNVYDEAEELVEDDEISGAEEGFMEGYNKEKGALECDNCGNILTGKPILKEFEEVMHKFCSKKCSKEYQVDTE